MGEQGWRSGESTRLQPMWLWLGSRTWGPFLERKKEFTERWRSF